MYEYNAIVKTVLDANTLELSVDLGFGVTIKRVFGIVGMNAPIFKTATTESDVADAQAAKAKAIEIISGKPVVVRTQKIGKFGRYTAEVFFNNTSYNDLMKNAGW
jgi:endonuclease YncB( thermonuclease family)